MSRWNVFCNENAPYRIYYRQSYILRNHEVFGKMTCRDWKNWLLDDAEPQFGIWF